MTSRGIKNIPNTSGNCCKEHFSTHVGFKVIPVFLPADWEDSWSLLSNLVSLLSGGIVQGKITISVFR